MVRVLLKPWDAIPGVQKTELLRRNVKTIASIFLQIMMDYIKNGVANQPTNQQHLPNQLKCNPRTVGPFRAEDEKVDPDEVYVRKGKKGEEEDIIEGLYTREQLQPLFLTKKTWYTRPPPFVDTP